MLSPQSIEHLSALVQLPPTHFHPVVMPSQFGHPTDEESPSSHHSEFCFFPFPDFIRSFGFKRGDFLRFAVFTNVYKGKECRAGVIKFTRDKIFRVYFYGNFG